MKYEDFKSAADIADNLSFQLYNAYSYARCAEHPPIDFTREEAIKRFDDAIDDIKSIVKELNFALESLSIDIF